MKFDRSRLRWLKTLRVYRLLTLPRRAFTGFRYIAPDLGSLAVWLFRSREDTNFTYALTERNLLYLCHLISVVTGAPLSRVQEIIGEIESDDALRDRIRRSIEQSLFRPVSDSTVYYSRRVGWYALVRLLKPRVVIETGVDKGLGAIVICAALQRNAAEGAPGRYYGTDIVPTAGWLLQAPYSEFGEILVGDSIESLSRFDQAIDLFINDSDHSDAYEAREYEVIADKLSDRGIIIGDNAHETTKLAEFAVRRNMAFLFFKEEPEGHWYPGAGLGIAYRREAVAAGS